MKKLIFLFALIASVYSMSAQLSKSEVENMMKSVAVSELQDVFLIRTREHDGTSQGWFEKYERLDPKTLKITYSEHSVLLEGNNYSAFVPYDKIKLIFHKKANYLSIELID